jgi:hypothetical protein
VKSLADEIKQLAETLSKIEEGVVVGIHNLNNLIKTMTSKEAGFVPGFSEWRVIDEHSEGDNIILGLHDSGLGHVWIKVPKDQIPPIPNQNMFQAKKKRPPIPLSDKIKIKYNDQEKNINWHGSSVEFIKLFNSNKFPKTPISPNEDYYLGNLWSRAGTKVRQGETITGHAIDDEGDWS